MDEQEYYKKHKNKAENVFKKIDTIRCPYFEGSVTFNSDGFHHLRFLPNGRERKHKAQLLKFKLLPFAKHIIAKSGTIQEYRTQLVAVGRKGKRDGLQKTKQAEYWGLYAIVGEDKRIRIRVILRRVGDGKIIFWSVMPDMNLKSGKLYKNDILES
ncbi:MAG TPA: hypothetical protein ENI66_02105 [Candidatus Yonathbacteria bacterium]|nr:hypothetical protein [Candidatus Yonathbacteria bacterium]